MIEAYGCRSPTQMVLRNKGLAAKIREGLRDDESLSTAFLYALCPQWCYVINESKEFMSDFCPPQSCYVGSQSEAFISAIAGWCPPQRKPTVFFSAIAGFCHVDARLCGAELHGTDKEVREAIEEGKDRLAVLVPAT
jgi:hypothetical protein